MITSQIENLLQQRVCLFERISEAAAEIKKVDNWIAILRYQELDANLKQAAEEAAKS